MLHLAHVHHSISTKGCLRKFSLPMGLVLPIRAQLQLAPRQRCCHTCRTQALGQLATGPGWRKLREAAGDPSPSLLCQVRNTPLAQHRAPASIWKQISAGHTITFSPTKSCSLQLNLGWHLLIGFISKYHESIAEIKSHLRVLSLL